MRGSYIEMSAKKLKDLIEDRWMALDADREVLLEEEVTRRQGEIWNRIKIWNGGHRRDIMVQVQADIQHGHEGRFPYPAIWYRYRHHRGDARKLLAELSCACEHAKNVYVSTADLREITR